jgi:predicted nuclease of restriction endonuclease-like RecB superfamily
MRIRIDPQEAAGYRQFFGAIKAYNLIYDLRGSAERGYEVTLDGPVSIFHRSQKYGVQMAVFLPALLGCEGWHMTAEIDARPRGTAVYELSAATAKIRAPASHDAARRHPVVEKILGGLLRADGEWRAEPSAEVIDLGETAFVPDVVARHEDGSVTYIEVIGFWTPKYLAARLAELSRAPRLAYLFVASAELLATRDAVEPEHPNVVIFKTSLDLKALRAALERVRCRDERTMA